LARHWQDNGGTAVPGHIMLLHQAAKQVQLMTGHSAPVDAMRIALDQALQNR
jgi:shikimate dehydrogenase